MTRSGGAQGGGHRPPQRPAACAPSLGGGAGGGMLPCMPCMYAAMGRGGCTGKTLCVSSRADHRPQRAGGRAAGRPCALRVAVRRATRAAVLPARGTGRAVQALVGLTCGYTCLRRRSFFARATARCSWACPSARSSTAPSPGSPSRRCDAAPPRRVWLQGHVAGARPCAEDSILSGRTAIRSNPKSETFAAATSPSVGGLLRHCGAAALQPLHDGVYKGWARLGGQERCSRGAARWTVLGRNTGTSAGACANARARCPHFPRRPSRLSRTCSATTRCACCHASVY